MRRLSLVSRFYANQFTTCVSEEERFFHYVEQSDYCWNWLGYLDNDGYGLFSSKVLSSRKGQCRAHRLSYELFYGVHLTKEIIVRHTCDNRACVNPHHLITGTQADNIRDRENRGRTAKGWKMSPDKLRIGEKNPNCKLNAEQVLKIRQKALHMSNDQLAREFGVHKDTIKQILKRITWKHLVS